MRRSSRLFDPAAELFAARAPGRLDVMGGIADYSGSLVLQLPIREATMVAIQRTGERTLCLHSPAPGRAGRRELVELDLDELLASGGAKDYRDARRHFSDPSLHWAAYVAGVWIVLARELGLRLPGGARVEIRSTVPEGKGVSSSAALEVATLHAVCRAWELELDNRRRALLCQTVENEVAGAPCGVMDQMTATLGEADRLLALRCRPATVEGHLPVPAAIAFAGLDSGVRHAVSGADYTTVRAAAFMGRRILRESRELEHLTELTPTELSSRPEWPLPERLGGAGFLERFRHHDDPVTPIDAHVQYPVLAATRHAVEEHHRVERFARLLAAPSSESTLEELGALMMESHHSYGACGLGTARTDRLVALALEEGLAGGRITGGGSGGTVAVVGRREELPARLERIATRFERETRYRPHVFEGSSPGAMSVPARVVEAV